MKDKKSKIVFETTCDKHGNKTTHKDTQGKSVWGDPPGHDRYLKHGGCPICKAQENKS